jgi:N-acetylneuraminic acid mutarotase
MHSKTSEWTKIEAKEPPSKRCAHTSSFFQNKFYIFPGFQPEEETQNNIPFFNTITKEWDNSILLKPGNPKRQQSVSFQYKNNFYLQGGSFDGNFFDRYSNSLFKYSFELNEWKEVLCSKNVPLPRFKHTGSCVNDSFVIYGGMNPQLNLLFNDVHVFDLKKEKWNPLKIVNDKSVPITGRMAHCSANDGELIYIFGGKSTDTDQRFNTLYTLEIQEGKCTFNLLPNYGNVPAERAGCTLNYFNNSLFMFGGFTGEKDVFLVLFDTYR